MLQLTRWISLLATTALLILMIGPFQGAENASGVSDKFAHVVAFAIITASAFLNLRKAGRLEAAVLALVVAVAVEIVQGLTGRDADVRDVVADSLGIISVAALWPGRRLLKGRAS